MMAPWSINEHHGLRSNLVQLSNLEQLLTQSAINHSNQVTYNSIWLMPISTVPMMETSMTVFNNAQNEAIAANCTYLLVNRQNVQLV